jgi:hypothetical protein
VNIKKKEIANFVVEALKLGLFGDRTATGTGL